MKYTRLFILILLSMPLFAQSAIPSGTILPVALNSSLHSNRNKPGQTVTARIMQDVPLSDGSRIPAGAKLIGHVTEAPQASGGTFGLRFDKVVFAGHQIPVNTSLRAVAGLMGVWEAQLPTNATDRATPEQNWTTVQVGDDEVVYRGGGGVTHGEDIVGQPTPDGVLVRVGASPGSNCRGEIDGNREMQALWVFSSDACGVYDLPHVQIIHRGRSNPAGEIVLASSKGAVNITAGSGMLLRVNRAAN